MASADHAYDHHFSHRPANAHEHGTLSRLLLCPEEKCRRRAHALFASFPEVRHAGDRSEINSFGWLDADERVSGYLRDPHLPVFDSFGEAQKGGNDGAKQSESSQTRRTIMYNTELAKGNGIVRAATNDLSPLARKEITDLLNRRLADTLDLMLQAKQAHWTITGRNFLSLHQLFDKIAAEASESGDLLAERAMQLGGRAEGTAAAVVRISQLEPYPVTLSGADEHVERMSSTLAHYARLIRQAIAECADHDDAATADIFTQISRAADKCRWLVEAHKEWR